MTRSVSDSMFERASAVIPKGIYGHYGPPAGTGRPSFFQSAEGSRFIDVDGRSYIDWMCAYGPMIMGYNHAGIEQAAARQVSAGNTVTLVAPVLVDLAEHLVDMVQGGDWVLFGKNGADATALAVMVARAATGRRKIVKIDGGYHGTAPWMQAPGATGTIVEDQAFVVSVPWNDTAALASTIAEHGDDIACFISSPYHHPTMQDNVLPAAGYWPAVEQMCRAAGIVTILDDVRSGFRIDLAGSHVAFGFQPDLMCFGKALANGHPISALVGVEALRQPAGETFYTGTQFFNAGPMAAALATLQALQEVNAAQRITEIGNRLNTGLVGVAARHGFELRVSGVPGMPYYRLISDEGSALHRQFFDRCIDGGAYFLSYHNNFVSAAHTDVDLEETWEIADQVLASLVAERE